MITFARDDDRSGSDDGFAKVADSISSSLSAVTYPFEAAALEKEHLLGKDVREDRRETVTKGCTTEMLAVEDI